MNKLYKSINPTNLLKPIYFSGFIICHITLSYNDSLIRLTQYRNNEIKKYYSEWDAAKSGSYEFFFVNLWESFFWPVSLSSNIIPYIVLKINS
jgi:hypothetical protein